ncbi:hypothetical protein DR62_07635 [Burkholderia thailandensis]|nr:hypothetical protein DR62_07635 [Burkholderia thailandensis]AOI55227.1 hypothetical protein WI24_26035 [Burkholderia thailandensis]AOJ54257.1 hypothetical protein AQ475_26195 [Burkholderia thailandensis]AOJ60155.1 hypothetical protein AQ477_27195 [Burkholderia thailandensis]AVR27585.1 hypothetical protein A8H32_21375 [Burkholderia thailandensis]
MRRGGSRGRAIALHAPVLARATYSTGTVTRGRVCDARRKKSNVRLTAARGTNRGSPRAAHERRT